ncbi:MAG: hypothetical protein GKR86_14420, partial [Ilumatobacter sp.]|nr:hypothetical protein [Ilumatobacter sp.]
MATTLIALMLWRWTTLLPVAIAVFAASAESPTAVPSVALGMAAGAPTPTAVFWAPVV